MSRNPENHVPHNRHHKVSSLMKFHQTHNIISNMKYMKMSESPVGHEVLCKQYLRAFLDIGYAGANAEDRTELFNYMLRHRSQLCDFTNAREKESR